MLKTSKAKKIEVIFEDSAPMSKQDFSSKIDQLASRLNYHKDHQSTKQRFLKAVRRYKPLTK